MLTSLAKSGELIINDFASDFFSRLRMYISNELTIPLCSVAKYLGGTLPHEHATYGKGKATIGISRQR